MAHLWTPFSRIRVASVACGLGLTCAFTLTLTFTVISCKSGSSGGGGASADGGEVTIDAYGKSDDEDDFKIAGQPTAVTGGGLALAGIPIPNFTPNSTAKFASDYNYNSNLRPMRLDGSYSCTMTLQKVDRDAFTLVDVGATASCALAPAPASGLYFRMTRLESDALYVATVRAIDPVSNANKVYKIAIPPMNSACRAGVTQFTMIADTLTTRVANVVLELVAQASAAGAMTGGADVNAQKTLRNLILPDLEHFAAASRQEFSVAARTYSETFSRIYDEHYASQDDQYETAVCQALIGTVLKTGSIAENTSLPSQSSAVQSWLAIAKIADAFNEEVKTVYTVTNVTASFDGFFGYLAAVIKAADTADQVSAVIEIAPANQNATVETISELTGDTGSSTGGGGTTSGGGTGSSSSTGSSGGSGSTSGGGSSQTPNTWLAMTDTNSPAARRNHAAVWTGTSMIVWGGQSDSNLLNTGAIYSPLTDSWTTTTTAGAPTARYRHSAVWNDLNSKMIVWGGYGTNYLNDGGQYDPATNSWTVTATTDAPAARSLHSAVWTGSKMIVWGGDVSGVAEMYGTGGIYDPNVGIAGGSWTPTDPSPSAPKGRSLHTAVWTGSEMIIWGGYVTGLSDENSGGSYDPSTNLWIPMTTTNAPSARQDHTAVWTGSKMIVWGGFSGLYFSDGGQFDPAGGAGGAWTPTNNAGAPAARNYHTAVWTGTKMIVWGGSDSTITLNSGGIYDLANDSWSATTSTDAPSARWLHSAFWTGTKMLIWGGAVATGAASDINTGSLYAP